MEELKPRLANDKLKHLEKNCMEINTSALLLLSRLGVGSANDLLNSQPNFTANIAKDVQKKEKIKKFMLTIFLSSFFVICIMLLPVFFGSASTLVNLVYTACVLFPLCIALTSYGIVALILIYRNRTVEIKKLEDLSRKLLIPSLSEMLVTNTNTLRERAENIILSIAWDIIKLQKELGAKSLQSIDIEILRATLKERFDLFKSFDLLTLWEDWEPVYFGAKKFFDNDPKIKPESLRLPYMD